MSRDMLDLCGFIQANDRVVVARVLITGRRVTAGIEYAPTPPFSTARPKQRRRIVAAPMLTQRLVRVQAGGTQPHRRLTCSDLTYSENLA